MLTLSSQSSLGLPVWLDCTRASTALSLISGMESSVTRIPRGYTGCKQTCFRQYPGVCCTLKARPSKSSSPSTGCATYQPFSPHANLSDLQKHVPCLLAFIQKLCRGTSQYPPLLRAKLQKRLPHAPTSWPLNLEQWPPGSGDVRKICWRELGNTFPTSSTSVTLTSMQIAVLETS